MPLGLMRKQKKKLDVCCQMSDEANKNRTADETRKQLTILSLLAWPSLGFWPIKVESGLNIIVL
jgi:hypothetical protein